MKKFPFIIIVILTFMAEVALCFVFVGRIQDKGQDTVTVNECLHSVSEHFGEEEYYSDALPYTLIDNDGNVLFNNREGNSLSVNEAVKKGDLILDVVVQEAVTAGEGEPDGNTSSVVIGKMIFHNETSERIEKAKTGLILTVVLFSVFQMALIIVYYIYLQRTIVKPFEKLNDFALRIAGGNLDVPLDVDKRHIFGSFTEAFDIMRSELKAAQKAEKQASDDKKETIAKLSHDIKTPVASIKSTSEIGYELAGDDKSKEYFHLINMKADQITALTDNLFNSSVHEATEITVTPIRLSSQVVSDCLKNADYLNRTDHQNNPGAIDIPECMVFADKLRLQQAFDNIFMNSYKYADTKMEVESHLENEYLVVRIRDFGPGVREEELPLLKEKYKRGSNIEGKDGAGLGLYLTDYFLSAMDGKLRLESPKDGFIVEIRLRVV